MTKLARSNRAALAGAASGLLLALAFPPFGFVPLLPLALIPWFWAVSVEERRGRGALSGFLLGLVFWLASVPWLAYVVVHFGGVPLALGIGVLLLLAAILSLYPAAVGWATVGAAAPGSLWRLAALPFLWVASEHLRAHLWSGFPWNLLAYPLYRHPLWIQTASLWGAYGVSGLVAAASVLLILLATRRNPIRSAASASLLLLLGGVAVCGEARLIAHGREIPTWAVAAVQPNIAQELRWTPEKAAENYGLVMGEAREAASRRPDLLLLPESALPVTFDQSPVLRRDLAEVAATCGCSILFNDVVEDPGGRYYNAARVVGPEGPASSVYRKVHLVPFGEYVPLKKLLRFARALTREVGDFSAADGPVLLPARGASLGAAVCYEVVYPALARREVRDGATALVTITNDAWYGRAGAQKQHLAAAVFRAVENGRPLARAAITGISAIIDSEGRIEAYAEENVRKTIYAAVSPRRDRTVWTRWGIVFVVLADAVAIAVVIFAIAGIRRR